MTAEIYPIVDPRHADRAASGPPEVGRLGMWIFIATELLFFGGLLFAYLYGRTHWPRGFALAGRHTHVVLGTLNTAVLLTSSALIALAVAASECEAQRRWTARLLWLTAALGGAFLAIKGFEYFKEIGEGLYPHQGFPLAEQGTELFFWLYWLMTGVHAVHLVIGIAGVGVFAWAAQRAKPWASSDRIDVIALYWHFVDVIWIFLYPLLYLVERHS